MIKNLIFRVYLLIPNFLEKRQKTKKKKKKKKDYSFYNTVLLKEPHSFYKSQLLQHYKKYTPVKRAKTYF